MTHIIFHIQSYTLLLWPNKNYFCMLLHAICIPFHRCIIFRYNQSLPNHLLLEFSLFSNFSIIYNVIFVYQSRPFIILIQALKALSSRLTFFFLLCSPLISSMTCAVYFTLSSSLKKVIVLEIFASQSCENSMR